LGGSQDHPGTTGSEAELALFASLLRSSPHNLLSPRGLEELEVRHFPEAVGFAATLPRGPRLLDVGSGGGLPGLVIALVRPDLEVHLLEATKKKCDFLEQAIATLGLNVTVHHGRAEDLAVGSLARTFDIVTARAVAPLDRLIPWVAPFLRPGGQLHAIKGERWHEELATADPQRRRHGLVVVGRPSGAGGKESEAGPRVVVLERRQSMVGNDTK